MRYRSHRGASSTTSWRFLVMIQNMDAIPEIVGYRTIIARRLVTSLDVMPSCGYLFTPYFHMFSPARASHDVVPWACNTTSFRFHDDFNRTMASASRQTIVMQSYDFHMILY